MYYSCFTATARFKRIDLRKDAADDSVATLVASPDDAKSISSRLWGKKDGVGGIHVHRNSSQSVSITDR